MIGEYWFYDGDSVFADGDVGDTDHIMHAQEHFYSLFVDALEASNDARLQDLASSLAGYVDAACDCALIREVINDWADTKQKCGQLTEKQVDDIHAFIRRKIKWSQLSLKTLINDDADVRLYAVQYWGWIRAKQQDIELWQMTKPVLLQLADSIYSTQDDVFPPGEAFNIYERKTGIMYRDVPLHVIASGDVRFIRKTCNYTKYNIVHS